MANGMNLRKKGVFGRMAEHPLAALTGALVSAALFGIIGTVHGKEVAVAVAVLGAGVGAVLGGLLGASSQRDL